MPQSEHIEKMSELLNVSYDYLMSVALVQSYSEPMEKIDSLDISNLTEEQITILKSLIVIMHEANDGKK